MSMVWRAGTATGVLVLLVSGCGSGDAAAPSPAGPGPAASAVTEASVEPRSGDAPAAAGHLPDEQTLCGAVDEAPVVDVLGGPVAVRAFNPPSGSAVNVSCVWENDSGTRSVTIRFGSTPNFRDAVDNDLLAEYGEGEFTGLGVEAHRTVYKGVILAGPHGWAVEVAVAGTVTPTDGQLTALGRAALTAAETTS
ncbi:hypothetical protein [Solwaraspora sp. WMMA2101]